MIRPFQLFTLKQQTAAAECTKWDLPATLIWLPWSDLEKYSFCYNELWWPRTVLLTKSEYKRIIREATFSTTAAAATHKTGLTCTSHCGYSKVASFDHSKLWWSSLVYSLSVISQMLFLLPQQFFFIKSQIVQENSTVLF